MFQVPVAVGQQEVKSWQVSSPSGLHNPKTSMSAIPNCGFKLTHYAFDPTLDTADIINLANKPVRLRPDCNI